MMSMIQAVTDLIAEEDPSAAVIFQREIGKGDLESLNAYFRGKLSQAPIPTRDQRSCLMNDISEKQWLEYFKNIILPVVHRFHLIK